MGPDEVRPDDFLRALSRARVRWLLIGRRALIHYGAPLQTMDYDVWIDPAARNVGKLLRVARDLGLEGPGRPRDVAASPFFSLFGGSLKVDVFKVRTFTNLDGRRVDFAGAHRRRVRMSAPGDPLVLPLPSLADLRLLKRMRDSEKDREDLRTLDALARFARG